MDKLNSTEKLLKVIRKKGDGPPGEFSGSSGYSSTDIPSAKSGFSPSLSKLIPFQKQTAIGVDISHTALRLVKITKHTDNKWKLLDFKSVPFPPQISKETPEFANFLKSELVKFCGPLVRKIQIWTAISAEGVEIHHISIPMVAQKQLRDAVYMTVKREFPFDEEESIFDFEVQGEVVKGGIPKLSVMVYSASSREVGKLEKLFSNIGIPLTGISIIPFAIQNIFRTGCMQTGKETVAGLFIGNNFSRIDIFTLGNLVMTRGIKAGVNSMAESLMDAFNEKGYSSPELPGEKVSIGLEEARKLIFTLNSDSDAITENNIFGIKKEEIFAMILPALERLISQVDRTFEHYTVNMMAPKVSKIYISAIMNVYKPLVDHVGEQLGMEREVFDPLLSLERSPLPGDANLAYMPDRFALVPALGLALSDNAHTPNLIFTYEEKEKESSIARTNWAIFLVFITAVSLCSFGFLYQINAVNQKRAAAAALERQLSEYNPPVDRNFILQINESVRQQWKKLEAYSHKYLAMAVISEVSALTPSNIRILDLKISPEGSTAKGVEPEKTKVSGGDVIVEGIVLGTSTEMEAVLTEYTIKLNASPMFGDVSIKKNSLEPFKNGNLLHFIITLRLGSNHGTKG